MIPCLIIFLLHAQILADGGSVWPPPEKLKEIRSLCGEELVYSVRLFKMGVDLDVGQGIFRVHNGPDLVISTTARGEKFGYELKVDITTQLDAETGLPRSFHMLQRGSEQREKRIEFREENDERIALYVKKKHCHDPECTNPDHMVDAIDWHFVIPWGHKRVHCNSCDRERHHVWKIRKRHALDRPFLDVLTALYLSRVSQLEIGGEPLSFPIVQDRELWLVNVSALKRETVTVEAGTFHALVVVLEPVPAPQNPKAEQRFEGLFGISGSIRVWIDEETRRPIRVRGTLPFGPMDLNAEVSLASVRSQPDSWLKGRLEMTTSKDDEEKGGR